MVVSYPKTLAEWKEHYHNLLQSQIIELPPLEQCKHEALANWVTRNVSQSLVLDVGCGFGFLGHLLGKEYVGVDVCKDAIKLARRLTCRRCGRLDDLPYIRDFVVADMDHLPFRPDVFDCAVFSDSVYYSSNVHRVLSQTFQSLKLGGLCAILHHSQRFISTIEPVLSYLETLGGYSSTSFERLGEPFKLLFSFRK